MITSMRFLRPAGLTGRIAGLTLCLMILFSCGDKHLTETPGKEEQTRPEWLAQRPHSSAYYIGIASCSKIAQPLDYQAIAKKNALNDLASEISVRVQGETFLNSLEVNKNFSEEFISTISTTTNEQIENYEIAGQWENKNEFWVYYRLSKAEYQRIKAQKKNLALNSANDFYTKGKEAESRVELPAAIDLYMRGLFALKDYWSEVNEYTTPEGTVYLDNDLYEAIRRVISGVMIIPGGEKIILSSENKFYAQFPVRVTYEGKPARGIGLKYSYQRESYMKPRLLISDPEGKTAVEVNGVSTSTESNWLDLSLDMESLLPSDLDKTITAGLVRTIRADSHRVPIELQTPSFYIESTEKNYGAVSQMLMLSSAFQGELVKRGMRISGNKPESTFLVSISSNTTEGGSSQGFTVAFLEMNVQVTDQRTNETIYKESAGSIKGLQLNKEAASIEAYKKGREKIEMEIVKTLLDRIL
jgi:hypothetical protein